MQSLESKIGELLEDDIHSNLCKNNVLLWIRLMLLFNEQLILTSLIQTWILTLYADKMQLR